MPIVQLTSQTETFNLKTAPPDGFVTLRRMSHGEALRRRDGSAAMSAKEFNRKGVPGEVFMNAHQEWMRFYDFQLCITEHNLQKADGELFNFKNRKEFDLLPANVGLEIEELIDTVNGWDEDFSSGDGDSEDVPFGLPVTESSMEEKSPTVN